MQRWMRRIAFCGLYLALHHSSVDAFNAVVDSLGGAKSSTYASGRIVEGESNVMAQWGLTTTAASTDFTNDSLVVGDRGVMYVMRNDVKGSRSVNDIVYSVAPQPNVRLNGISISQSPYNDNGATWNGGNLEASQFQLRWIGGGVARVTDPLNQLAQLGNGSTIGPDTLVRFSEPKITNDKDAWRIDVPSGVTAVRISWSSANPTASSDLTREWVTFAPILQAVPEPATLTLLGIMMATLLMVIRRR